MRESRLSQYKQERLLELFIVGSTARIASRAGWCPTGTQPLTILTGSEC